MKVYNYIEDTKEYVSTSEAQENPLEPGVYLIPANATFIKPEDTRIGFTQVFYNNSWHYEEDNRGKIAYSILDKAPIMIDYIGEVHKDYTLLVPKDTDIWSNDSWIEDIAKTRLAKLKEIDIKISELEKKAERPIRELLSKLTSVETKEFAQNKLDEIEQDIQDLRLKRKAL